MNTIIYSAFACAVVFVIEYIVLLICLVLISTSLKKYSYASNYIEASYRARVNLYRPIDLMYLYAITSRVDELSGIYDVNYGRANMDRKTAFAWVFTLAHTDDWDKLAAQFDENMKSEDISSELKSKISNAIQAKNINAIDKIYLEDMNGNIVIHPPVTVMVAVYLLALLVTTLFVVVLYSVLRHYF